MCKLFHLTYLWENGFLIFLLLGQTGCSGPPHSLNADIDQTLTPQFQQPGGAPSVTGIPPLDADAQTGIPALGAQGFDPGSSMVISPGWIDLPPKKDGDPPIRRYVCPWIEAAPEIPPYTYRVIRSYPHDPKAYTQGLLFRDGLLLESTGLRGRSSLRQVNLENGKIIRQVDLPEPYFGEGITLIYGEVFQLTWQEQTAFVFDLDNFNQIGTFHYKTEGWGLTDDGQRLIMSDGTSQLSIRDPRTFGVILAIEVTSGHGSVSKLNELEYVNGEIWANIYQTACIARINPDNGQVIGWIDLTGILGDEYAAGVDVPNGIAYDPIRQRLLVTGKLWPWLYEIEVLAQGQH